jgi:DNA-nicking Smr family endonuclease
MTMNESDWDPEDGITLEVTDVLDLHSFPPREIRDLVRDYLELAEEKGLRELRIIHGRGVGVQRQTVRKILEKHPRVQDYQDAPSEAGGWGATLVWIRAGEEGQEE